MEQNERIDSAAGERIGRKRRNTAAGGPRCKLRPARRNRRRRGDGIASAGPRASGHGRPAGQQTGRIRGRKHGRGAFRGACGLDCGRIDPDTAL